ncbi:carboxypeptidase regulatory-like domain-containing protein [Silvibacterium sp.]|uniref:TonB-dependent receptor n=1 Tax=Silvibacterium sp. TaxID=1964179 RepID=UPI0039E4DB06
MKRISTCLMWVLMLVTACIPAMAQTVTGSIRGTITDPSGAIVPNAKVTATNTATSVNTVATTNGAGEYSVRFLQIGQYTITVEAQGFNTAHYGPFALEIDQDAKIDIPLTVGNTSTTVTVKEELQPILQTENATNGETFTENTINSVPLNGRDFTQLTAFTPGAVVTGYGSFGGANSTERSTGDANEANVNGSRQQSNNYLLDGQEINENINNTVGYTPSPDSIEQMRVVSSNANAEFGNVNGGEVLMVMKSGSNKFHGSVFGFLQNDNLDANSWANDNNVTPIAKNPFTQAIFGGTFGGPIIKDKLFFFVDYEGMRYHTGGETDYSLATPAMLKGDLSNLYDINSSGGIQLYDTQTLQANGTPTPYANNQVPVNSPIAQFLAAHPNAYPAPNNATDDPTGVYKNFVGPSGTFQTNDQGDVKIDYHPRLNDVISGRYSQGYAQNATTHDPLPVEFPSASNYPDHLGTLNWTHTLSPAIVNLARASYSRIQFNSGVTTDPSGIFGLDGNSIVGIPSKAQETAGFSSQSFSTSSATGMPSDFGTNPTPEVFVDNVFEYADDLTWQYQKHLFKFGASFIRYQQNSFYPGNDGELGSFSYDGQYSTYGTAAYPFADFLLDRVNSASVGAVTGLTGQRQWRDGIFAQDDWKVSDKLTLNLGLRWEFDQPIYEVNNKMANLNLATGAVEYAGVDGNSRALYDPYYAQVQPRFGFAYAITPRWVIRGGYGITSYFEGMGANLRLTQNPPFHTDYQETGVNPSTNSTTGVYSSGTYYMASNGFPTTTPPTTTFYAWPKDMKPSSTQEITLTTEYQLAANTSVQLGYVGILGHHLTNPYWGNQRPSPDVLGPYDSLVGTVNGENYAAGTNPDPSTVDTGVVKISATNAASNYNAMQAVFRQRLTDGLELTANYTLAHAMTDSFGYYGVSNISGGYYQQNAYDMRAEWGDAGFDIRQALSVSGEYALPFGRGRQFGANMNRAFDEAVGGWKLALTDVTYTAFPLTAGTTSNYSSKVYSATARPEQYRPLHVTGRSLAAWFGTAVQPGGSEAACSVDTNNGTCVFAPQPSTTFGNVRPMTLRGDGYEQVDAALSKSFPIWKEHALAFRADFFNLLNVASYSAPDGTVTDSNFGQITGTNSTERRIQLSLKYAF